MQGKPNNPLTIKPAPLNSRQAPTTHKEPSHPKKAEDKKPTAAELEKTKLIQELAETKAKIKEAEARAASAEARAAAAMVAEDLNPKSQELSAPPPPPLITNSVSPATVIPRPTADPRRSDFLESIKAGSKLKPVISNTKQEPSSPKKSWIAEALDKKFAGMNPDSKTR